MCGIAGMIDWKNGAPEEIVCRRMQDTLRRRGPDQEGIWRDGPAALIHTRLCVVDIERGRQPFIGVGPDGGTYVLVYNGELYNTEALRRELSAAGHRFTGHSDTEVVLHGYMEWGEGCVEKFNGIFAFAVWEQRRERLFIARDRIGVKPFFYAERDGNFLFASEIKALLASGVIPPEIDQNGVLEVMLIGPGRTPGCGVFRGVKELEPGWCGMYDRSGLRLRRYWRLVDRENRDTFPETVERVRQLVTDAVQRQLVSDVPVCTFLSGGLDSSIISAIADRYFRERGQTLHTFSVTYKDNDKYFQAGKFQPNSDDAYIRIMAAALHGEHHIVELDSEEVARALYAAAEARDLPGMADVDSSLLLFCQEIKRHATVALSGECADEIFGGYPWYRDSTIREREGFPWAQSTDYRASFLRPEWLAGTDPFAFVDSRYRATVADADILPGTDPTDRRMKEMVQLNFSWFMQSLLDRKDRMSMDCGLEVRVPFCDYRIAEYLYTVPWRYKDFQGREKGLLREAMAGLLPEEILHRKKSPYPKTHHPVYLAAVERMLADVLANPAAPVFQIVRRPALEALLRGEGEDRANVPWYGQLMTRPQTIAWFVQLNHWLETYRIKLV